MTDDPLIGTTAIDTITIDPNDHNTVYAGTGDLNYGSFSMGSQGILKSTDAGATWTSARRRHFRSELRRNRPGSSRSITRLVRCEWTRTTATTWLPAPRRVSISRMTAGLTGLAPARLIASAHSARTSTGLELTNMGGGVTRIVAAVGVRGFPHLCSMTSVPTAQMGFIKARCQSAVAQPTSASSSRNDNGFVFGTAVTGSPYCNRCEHECRQRRCLRLSYYRWHWSLCQRQEPARTHRDCSGAEQSQRPLCTGAVDRMEQQCRLRQYQRLPARRVVQHQRRR